MCSKALKSYIVASSDTNTRGEAAIHLRANEGEDHAGADAAADAVLVKVQKVHGPKRKRKSQDVLNAASARNSANGNDIFTSTEVTLYQYALFSGFQGPQWQYVSGTKKRQSSATANHRIQAVDHNMAVSHTSGDTEVATDQDVVVAKVEGSSSNHGASEAVDAAAEVTVAEVEEVEVVAAVEEDAGYPHPRTPATASWGSRTDVPTHARYVSVPST